MKKLVKEVAFGKATARITVEKELQNKHLDGMKIGEEWVTLSKVEIVAPNGEVVTDGFRATIIGNRSIVGKAETTALDAGKNINKAIEKMNQEILNQEEVKKETNEVEVAEKIVAEAENKGVKNLMTNEEMGKWKKGYNDLVNEGGEGYIPTPVTQDDYDRALKIVKE